MLIPLWLSLSVHEWAHARTAFRLGDDTAKLLGRMTLNPLAHIDPVGTLLFPLLGIPFGWARPVPVQPQRFHAGVNMRTGMMIVAVAGPLANLALAALAIALVMVVAGFRVVPGHWIVPTYRFLNTMVLINVLLASFNALPIPPLDGSRVADALMPRPLRPVWEAFCRLGPIALIMVLVLPRVTGISLFHYPMQATQWLLEHAVGLAVR
jgi:Zn-dependent protease